MDSYIHDILLLSRNSRMEVQEVEIPLKKFIDEIIEEQNLFNIDSVTDIKVKIRGKHSLYSDPFRLKAILNNLISNAIRYKDFSKQVQKIKIKAQIDENEVRIIVEDNGIGIEEKYIGRIFEMFYRATEIRTGSGLGLYIAKETISKLGGSIQVESEFGQWTKFKIKIPNLSKGPNVVNFNSEVQLQL